MDPFSVVGLDLSGPAAPDSTGVAVFRANGFSFAQEEVLCHGSDREIYRLVKSLAAFGPVVVGIDAPLSYEAAGGMRARDRSLQKALAEIEMHPRHVMAPLAPRMVYLTLRGVAVTRLLSGCPAPNGITLLEVHPTASLALRGAPREAVVQFKKVPGARNDLLAWLRSQGLGGLRPSVGCSDHFVAACAAVLAAWKAYQGQAVWRAEAEAPWHPYDFVC